MPGLSGIEAAQHIGRRAHLVFVTAYDQYAVQAFAQGALDYLVKPVEPARLAETVARLQERLRAAQPAVNTEALLQQLAAQLAQCRRRRAAPLRWIRAQVGQTLRLIPVDEIDYLRSDEKYTLIAWRGDAGKPGEALVRIAAEGAAAAARRRAVRAGAPLGGREPARDQPRHARRQRDRRHPPQGPQGSAAGQPQLTCTCSGRCERAALRHLAALAQRQTRFGVSLQTSQTLSCSGEIMTRCDRSLCVCGNAPLHFDQAQHSWNAW